MKRYTFNAPHALIIVETHDGDIVDVEQRTPDTIYQYPVSRKQAAKILKRLRRYLVEEIDD